MRAVVADTGPLYALRDPDDQYHAQAHEEARRLEQDRTPIVVIWPTVLEAYGLVLRRLSLSDAHQWLAELQNGASFVNPTPDDYALASELVRRYRDQPITLFDALIAVMSERHEFGVWTFDHHLDILGANVWR